MDKQEFDNLVIHGFDIEFNYKDIFYSITSGKIEGVQYFFLANEKKWNVKFTSIQELDDYILFDKRIVDIISGLSEKDIFY